MVSRIIDKLAPSIAQTGTNHPYTEAWNYRMYLASSDCAAWVVVLHEHSLGNKAYGFYYDDVAEQAAFFSGKGNELTVTPRWDAELKGKYRLAAPGSRPGWPVMEPDLRRWRFCA